MSLLTISLYLFIFLPSVISWLQIHLTRHGSRGHHRGKRAREPETTIEVTTGANEDRKVISDLLPYSRYILDVSVFNSKGEGPRSETVPFNTDEGGKRWSEGKICTYGAKWAECVFRDVDD